MTRTQSGTQVVATEQVGDITESQLMSALFNVKGTTFISMDTETVPAFKGKKVDNPFWNSTESESRVTKVGGVYGMVGHIYKNVVNNARDKEVISAAEACGISKDELEKFFSKFDKSTSDMKDGEFVPSENKWAMFVDNPMQDGHSRILMKNKNYYKAHYESLDNAENVDLFFEDGHTDEDYDKCECRHQEDGKRYIMIWTFGSKDTKYVWSDSGNDLNDTDLEELQGWLRNKTSNATHQGLSEENEIVVRTFGLESIKGIRLNKIVYQIS